MQTPQPLFVIKKIKLLPDLSEHHCTIQGCADNSLSPRLSVSVSSTLVTPDLVEKTGDPGETDVDLMANFIQRSRHLQPQLETTV